MPGAFSRGHVPHPPYLAITTLLSTLADFQLQADIVAALVEVAAGEVSLADLRRTRAAQHEVADSCPCDLSRSRGKVRSRQITKVYTKPVLYVLLLKLRVTGVSEASRHAEK